MHCFIKNATDGSGQSVKEPIFLIGAPRSGTTIIFSLFATHPELAWFSHHQDAWPAIPILGLTNRLCTWLGPRLEREQAKGWRKMLPFPSEAWFLWKKCCGDKFLYDPLTHVEPSVNESARITSLTERILMLQGKSRFAAKLTGPPRISYLNRIFQDAIFIHIIRDGRAVVHSLMNVRFWKVGGGLERPWWNGFPDEYYDVWESEGRTPELLAALQWRYLHELYMQEIRHFPQNRCIEVRYEDFSRNPLKTLQEIYCKCGLGYHPGLEGFIKQRPVRNMNDKWRRSLPAEKIKRIEAVVGDVLAIYGYGTVGA